VGPLHKSSGSKEQLDPRKYSRIIKKPLTNYSINAASTLQVIALMSNKIWNNLILNVEQLSALSQSIVL